MGFEYYVQSRVQPYFSDIFEEWLPDNHIPPTNGYPAVFYDPTIRHMVTQNQYAENPFVTEPHYGAENHPDFISMYGWKGVSVTTS